jgi:protein gp37
MSEGTKIQWTAWRALIDGVEKWIAGYTYNHWRGCTKVPGRKGCANCYAERLVTTRLSGEWGKGAPRVLASESYRKQPYKWNRDAKRWAEVGQLIDRPRVFSLSLGDWLDPEVPNFYLAGLLKIIMECAALDWILVTKRQDLFRSQLARVADLADGALWNWVEAWLTGEPPKNVWIVASIEDQPSADKVVPELLQIPAVVRGLSIEPLLGPINLTDGLWERDSRDGETERDGIDWGIIGCESGPRRRAFDSQHAFSLVDQFEAAGVPLFTKQILVNGKVSGDPAEWPCPMPRQFPVVN